jgi:hypothetical protein
MVVCILQRSFYVTIGCVAFGVRSRQALMVKMVNSEVRGQGWNHKRKLKLGQTIIPLLALGRTEQAWQWNDLSNSEEIWLSLEDSVWLTKRNWWQ